MLSNFAGFYCSPQELAENSRAQRPITITFIIIAVMYVAWGSFLLKNAKNYSVAMRVAIYVLLPVGAVLILLGYFVALFHFEPHLCGSG